MHVQEKQIQWVIKHNSKEIIACNIVLLNTESNINTSFRILNLKLDLIVMDSDDLNVLYTY